MGIFGRLAIGWELAVSSWKAIWHNKSLMLFPFFSLAAQVAVIATYVMSDDALGILPMLKGLDDASATTDEKIVAWVVLFLIYMVFNTITIFFNVALISCAGRALSGHKPGVLQGFWDAFSRSHLILMWAAISSSVSIVLKMLEQHKRIGKILTAILGSLWSVLTYLVLPVMVFERVNPFRAIGRSKDLIFGNWGESLAGNIGMGLVTFVMFLPGCVMLAFGIVDEAALTTIMGFCWILLVMLWSSAASSVLTVAVYAYANHKDLKTNYYRDLSGLFYRADGRQTLDPHRSRVDNKLQIKGVGSPLHAAASDGVLFVVQAMLKKGADAYALDADGKTPYDRAVEAGHSGVADVLRQHMQEHPKGEGTFDF